MSAKRIAATACPCQSGLPYAQCCQPIHDSLQPAADACALMRSRYSAFALERRDWLLASWHPDTRPNATSLEEEGVAPRWIGLQIVRHENRDADHAIVEFIARCRVGGRASRLHETSRFVRADGRWYYLDGELHER